MNTKALNTGQSLASACNQLESQDGENEDINDDIHCCANENTNKLLCFSYRVINLSDSVTIDTSEKGLCDFAISGNSCSWFIQWDYIAFKFMY